MDSEPFDRHRRLSLTRKYTARRRSDMIVYRDKNENEQPKKSVESPEGILLNGHDTEEKVYHFMRPLIIEPKPNENGQSGSRRGSISSMTSNRSSREFSKSPSRSPSRSSICSKSVRFEEDEVVKVNTRDSKTYRRSGSRKPQRAYKKSHSHTNILPVQENDTHKLSPVQNFKNSRSSTLPRVVTRTRTSLLDNISEESDEDRRFRRRSTGSSWERTLRKMNIWEEPYNRKLK
ncbi:unnamed protein product, partial [Owenia fusiformis]